MTEYYLEKLHGIRIDTNPDNNEILIWVNHDKNFINGCYYRILDNHLLSFVVQKANEYYEIPITKEIK